MKPLLYLFIILLSSCGKESTADKFKRECPYKEEYSVAGHQLQVPVHIIPHQLKYKVGDTISIVVNMSDSIYDINTERTFKISNFPFKPLGLLYRFYNATQWDDGFRKVEYLVDTSNFIRTDGNGPHPEAMLLKYEYINNQYKLTLKLVLKEKGRYIFQLQDGVNDLRSNSEEFKKIKSITFEGKCPTFAFYPVNMIVGDDQMSYFEKELLYIDKEEFYDGWKTIKFKDSWMSPYGIGSFFWEYNATFGFEVE
jgi:hypothetical protein